MKTISQKATTTLSGTVKTIIVSRLPNVPDKAHINVAGADALYRELRIVNSLIGKDGYDVSLQPGQQVKVTFEADSKDTKRIPFYSSSVW
jgi:hypothetical protein